MSINKKADFPKLVVFFGPDGVGKTTQIILLRKILRKKHAKVKPIFIRSNHLFAYMFYKMLTKIRPHHFSHPDGFVEGPDPQLLLNLWDLWFYLQILSILLLIWWRVYLPLFFGYTVIAERYIPDIYTDLINMASHPGKPYRFKEKIIYLLLNFIPKNTVFICLDASHSKLLQRYKMRKSNQERPEYILLQKKFNKSFLKWRTSLYLDTSEMSISQVHRKIVEYVDSN
jgi:thymidylate kinase